MKCSKSRQIALRTLLRSQESRYAVESILARELRTTILSEADTGLTRELVSGCVRWRRLLDWLIARATNRREQNPIVQEILRLGLYQIFFLNRIPEHAIVDESVRLAKTWRCYAQSAFINAIMHRFLRERTKLNRDISELQEARPALGQSHPDWLFDAWEERWGREKTVRLMEWNNQPPPTFVRVNRLLTEPQRLVRRWQDEGVDTTPINHEWAEPDNLYRLRRHPPIESLASFREGCFYVQDPSTLLAVSMLNPQQGQTVLDLCAAPGGKTALIAEKINNRGLITALDRNETRLNLLRDNCSRLGITCVKIGKTDDRPLTKVKFDCVLADVPCSNTGVMRRRLDLRWRLAPREFSLLVNEQLKLLYRAANYTKPEGRLVYSTCSIEPDENEWLIKRFINENTEWELINEHTLHPLESHTDGAYAALLTRRT